MFAQKRYGYDKRKGYTAETLHYSVSNLQFVLLVPDEIDGLSVLEKS